MRHRVACVDDEVQHHLLELCGVHSDEAELGAEVHHELDVFPDEALEHPLAIAKLHTDVDDLRLQDLLAAEGEELTREHRGPLRCRDDLLDVGPQHVVGRKLARDDPREAEDRGEHVVEVVRDATRELPDRLHLLRLLELLLQ